ncbi:uncharacterized protein [Phyllobates terribilis]|uniref:uncharacterized protein isoform X3 n=1 Tax=Phyllobates terribilis TaxID=111132 RepID=UPI003CCA9B84
MASADLRNELDCSICLTLYTDPVTLRCGHNFCRVCIDQFLSTQDGDGVYTCPECREEFQERPGLKRNITFHNVEDIFLSTHLPQVEITGIRCTYCVDSSVPAVKSCLHCEASLCDNHLKVHSKSAEHIIVETSTLAEEYRGHLLEMLDEAFEKKKRKNLRNVFQKLITQKKETEEKVQSLVELRRKAQEKASGEAKRVIALFIDIRRQVDNLEKRVLSDISRRKEQVSLSLSDVIQKLEIKKDELSRNMRHIAELCNMTDPLIVLQEPDTGDLCDPEERGDEDTGGHDGGDEDTGGHDGGDEDTREHDGGDDDTGGYDGGDEDFAGHDDGGDEDTGGHDESEEDTGKNDGGEENTGKHDGGDEDTGGHDGGDEDMGGHDGGDEDTGGHDGGDEDMGGHDGGDEDTGGHDGGDEDTGGHDGGDENTGGHDGGDEDTGGHDGGDEDTGGHDGGDEDTGKHDGGDEDTGGHDGGDEDTGGHDGGDEDTGGHDGGDEDTGGHDGSDEDTGGHDGGDKDTGGHDGGDEDTGGHDGGDEDTGGHDGGDEDTGGHDGGDEDPGGHDGGDEDTGGHDGGDEDTGGHDGGDEDTGGHDGSDEDTGGHDGGDKDTGGHDGGDEDTGGHDGGDEDTGGHDGGDEDTEGYDGGDDTGGHDGDNEDTGGHDGDNEDTGGHDGDDRGAELISHISHISLMLSDMIRAVNVTLYGEGPADILLDVNTADENLQISNELKTATWTLTTQIRPEIEERFQYNQVMSRRGFTSGRHYWDVEIKESWRWRVGMCYPSIDRRGDHSYIGYNKKSWGLYGGPGYVNQCSVKHDNKYIRLPHQISSDGVRICLDYEAGQLSFYELCDPIRHLHTFTAAFTEPLHAILGVCGGSIKISGGQL